MEPELDHGEAEFTRKFKLEAVRLIKERGVSYAQASHEVHRAGPSIPALAPFLGSFSAPAGLVTLCQTFVVAATVAIALPGRRPR